MNTERLVHAPASPSRHKRLSGGWGTPSRPPSGHGRPRLMPLGSGRARVYVVIPPRSTPAAPHEVRDDPARPVTNQRGPENVLCSPEEDNLLEIKQDGVESPRRRDGGGRRGGGGGEPPLRGEERVGSEAVGSGKRKREASAGAARRTERRAATAKALLSWCVLPLARWTDGARATKSNVAVAEDQHSGLARAPRRSCT